MKSASRFWLLVFLFTISLPATLVTAAEPVVTKQYEGVSKRQVVDLWIAEADKAFRSPARVSHSGFTAKLASNMEIVAQNLLKAHALEPYRVDLLFGAANAHIYNKDANKAIKLFEQIYAEYPQDLDVNLYLASWYRFLKQPQASQKHLDILRQLQPAKAEQLVKVFAIIDRVATMSLTNKLPKKLDNSAALVTLGYALNPDGSMHPILIERLQTTLKLAQDNPEAIVVVTGGVPHNNQTEAKLMADWLVKNGIARHRVFEDNYAKDTVQNALFSRHILASKKIASAVIISSASHVRRGQALFEIASWETGPASIQYSAVIAEDLAAQSAKAIADDELMGIYRDALRVLGLWSFRSEPLLER